MAALIDSSKAKSDSDEKDAAEYLITNSKYHDCFLTVGNPATDKIEKIGVVSAYLAANSLEFRTMLGSCKQTDLPEAKFIITDISPTMFKLVLRFVYGGKLPTMSDIETAGLALIAAKYKFSLLKQKALKRLKPTSAEDVFPALICVTYASFPDLEVQVCKIVQQETDKIVESADFLKLDEASVIFILKQDTLKIDEVKLWKHVVRWAEYQVEINPTRTVRDCLEKIFGYVQIMTFTLNEILEFVLPTKVLSSVDLALVFTKEQPQKSSLPYNIKGKVNVNQDEVGTRDNEKKQEDKVEDDYSGLHNKLEKECENICTSNEFMDFSTPEPNNQPPKSSLLCDVLEKSDIEQNEEVETQHINENIGDKEKDDESGLRDESENVCTSYEFMDLSAPEPNNQPPKSSLLCDVQEKNDIEQNEEVETQHINENIGDKEKDDESGLRDESENVCTSNEFMDLSAPEPNNQPPKSSLLCDVQEKSDIEQNEEVETQHINENIGDKEKDDESGLCDESENDCESVVFDDSCFRVSDHFDIICKDYYSWRSNMIIVPHVPIEIDSLTCNSLLWEDVDPEDQTYDFDTPYEYECDITFGKVFLSQHVLTCKGNAYYDDEIVMPLQFHGLPVKINPDEKWNFHINWVLDGHPAYLLPTSGQSWSDIYVTRRHLKCKDLTIIYDGPFHVIKVAYRKL